MELLLTDAQWLLACAGLVALLPMGQLLAERAACPRPGGLLTAPRVLLDLAIAVLVTWVFGYAWVYGTSLAGLIGTAPGPAHLSAANPAWSSALVAWQCMAAAVVVVVAGTGGAERARPLSSAVSALLLAGLVFPLVAHWGWGGRPEGIPVGWLARLGLVDHGGAVVVHVVAGAAALANAMVLGPRRSRFTAHGRPRIMATGEPWLAGLGTLLVVAGGLGLIGAGRLGWRDDTVSGVVNGVIGAASGLVAAAISTGTGGRRLSMRNIHLGAVGGLVSVSGGALLGLPIWAALAGAVGGALAPRVDALILRARIDDPLGGGSAHLAAGLWGALAAALVVAGPGLPLRLVVQVLGALVAAGTSFGAVHAVLGAVDRRIPLRVSPFSEDEGSGPSSAVLRPLEAVASGAQPQVGEGEG